MSRISNRREKDKRRRAKLRKRLEEAGVDPEKIERIIETKREDDRRARHGFAPESAPTREEIPANTDESLWPDDTGYEPTAGDPLLRGPARVTGVTAKVVRRGSTITRYQFDHEVQP